MNIFTAVIKKFFSILTVQNIFLLVLILESPLLAQDFTSEKNGSGNWDNTSSWKNPPAPGYPQTASHNATIDINYTLSIPTGIELTIGSLTFLQHSKLYIAAGSTLTVQSISVLQNATIEVLGSLVVLGTVTMAQNSSLAVDLSGNVTVGGDFTGSTNATLNVNGTLNIDGNLSLGNNSEVTGSGSIGVTGTVNIPAGSDPGNIINNNNPQPIELVFFKISIEGNRIRSSWQTLTELNNDYFTVERSGDGLEFEAIGRIQGSGSTKEARNYSFTDEWPLAGRSYYRLRQTDFDGTTEIFPAVMVNRSQAASGVMLSPNPVGEDAPRLVLTGLSEREALRLTVSDLNGRVIWLGSLEPQPGGLIDQSIEQIATLQPGVYLLSATQSGRQFAQKFFKR